MIQRRQSDAVLFQQMMDIRDRYNSDIAIPLPDVAGAPEQRALIPQLIHDGIENTALKAASTIPIIECPASRKSDSARRLADDRRRALYGRWHANQLTIKLRRAYRQLSGYGTFAFTVMPDYKSQTARVTLRDPLSTYPELRSPDDIRTPLNVGFVYGRSTDWIRQNIPSLRNLINDTTPDEIWDVVEWIDEDDIVIGVLGPRQLVLSPGHSAQNLDVELHRERNRAGVVPVVVPRRVTLDRIAGQLNQIVPMVDWGAKLMALEIAAVERGVFPDVAIFSDNSMPAQVSDNQWKDGRTGEVNFVTNAKDVRIMGSSPGPLTNEAIDRLERAARLSGGISAAQSGELSGAIRSGRILDAMGAMSVDPRVQELQEIMGYALAELNVAIGAVEKNYFPKARLHAFSGWAGDDSAIDYIPEEVFAATDNYVAYAFPGSDLSATTIGLSQMVGGGLMSKKHARRKHPYIDDANAEERQILVEQVDNAVLSGFQQQVAAGQIPLIDAVNIRKKLDAGKPIAEAIWEADNEARERQAAVPPPSQPGPDQLPAGPPPESQPGLAMPGMGAESQPPELAGQVPGPTGDQDRLRMLLGALNAPRGAIPRAPMPSPN